MILFYMNGNTAEPVELDKTYKEVTSLEDLKGYKEIAELISADLLGTFFYNISGTDYLIFHDRAFVNYAARPSILDPSGEIVATGPLVIAGWNPAGKLRSLNRDDLSNILHSLVEVESLEPGDTWKVLESCFY